MQDHYGSTHEGDQEARLLDGDRAEILQDKVGEEVHGLQDQFLHAVQMQDGQEAGNLVNSFIRYLNSNDDT